MIKNVLKMLKWFLLFHILSLVVVSNCTLHLILREHTDDHLVYTEPTDDWDSIPESMPSAIERTEGAMFYLTCQIGGPGIFSDPELVWGRRTKELRFKNEGDLERMAQEHSQPLYELHNRSSKFVTTAFRWFHPLKLSDRGAHFCMSLKYNLFKIIHIKVKEESDPFEDAEKNDYKKECPKDRFRCATSGYCINLHYKCDGKSDCNDHSDERWDLCNGDPCEGKIHCIDGRCIPTSWCCDKRVDEDCTVSIRPSCCPPLPDPYDPLIGYNNDNNKDVKEIQKGNGSKYIFITICVISAILSFVLFLFVISKVCGFDAKPRTRNTDLSINCPSESPELTRCTHSECAIRREFSPNVRCLYRPASDVVQNSDNNNEADDPLIIIGSLNLTGRPFGDVSDQPPPYAEVVNSPPSIDKCALDDLINAPPPSYASMNNFNETENAIGNNLSASDNANNCSNNQSRRCDTGTSDNSNNNV